MVFQGVPWYTDTYMVNLGRQCFFIYCVSKLYGIPWFTCIKTPQYFALVFLFQNTMAFCHGKRLCIFIRGDTHVARLLTTYFSLCVHLCSCTHAPTHAHTHAHMILCLYVLAGKYDVMCSASHVHTYSRACIQVPPCSCLHNLTYLPSHSLAEQRPLTTHFHGTRFCLRKDYDY